MSLLKTWPNWALQIQLNWIWMDHCNVGLVIWTNPIHSTKSTESFKRPHRVPPYYKHQFTDVGTESLRPGRCTNWCEPISSSSQSNQPNNRKNLSNYFPVSVGHTKYNSSSDTLSLSLSLSFFVCLCLFFCSFGSISWAEAAKEASICVVGSRQNQQQQPTQSRKKATQQQQKKMPLTTCHYNFSTDLLRLLSSSYLYIYMCVCIYINNV